MRPAPRPVIGPPAPLPLLVDGAAGGWMLALLKEAAALVVALGILLPVVWLFAQSPIDKRIVLGAFKREKAEADKMLVGALGDKDNAEPIHKLFFDIVAANPDRFDRAVVGALSRQEPVIKRAIEGMFIAEGGRREAALAKSEAAERRIEAMSALMAEQTRQLAENAKAQGESARAQNTMSGAMDRISKAVDKLTTAVDRIDKHTQSEAVRVAVQAVQFEAMQQQVADIHKEQKERAAQDRRMRDDPVPFDRRHGERRSEDDR